MVIDSTDRDRLHISTSELHRMMEHEVCTLPKPIHCIYIIIVVLI
jgi:hypothetical protein